MDVYNKTRRKRLLEQEAPIGSYSLVTFRHLLDLRLLIYHSNLSILRS